MEAADCTSFRGRAHLLNFANNSVYCEKRGAVSEGPFFFHSLTFDILTAPLSSDFLHGLHVTIRGNHMKSFVWFRIVLWVPSLDSFVGRLLSRLEHHNENMLDSHESRAYYQIET